MTFLVSSMSIFAQINPVINEQDQILRRQEQEKLELLKKGSEQSNTKIQKQGDSLQEQEGGTLTGSALGLRANKGIVFFDVAAEFAFQIADHLKREKDIYRLKIGISI